MKNRYLFFIIFAVLFSEPLYAEKTYVGSDGCKSCHEEEFNNFTKYSQKAKSYLSVKKMKRNLEREEYLGCLKCHTTGYGKGGFVSIEKTPHLKNTGCESCHGPGSLHVESEDPEDIKGKLSIKDCVGCHNEKRVKGFKFKPMIYGGAH